MTTYYMGVYKERIHQRSCRVFQVSDSVDGLSCELLAEPKMLTVSYVSVKQMLNGAREFARLADCSHLEINCSKGKGCYHFFRVKEQ